MGFEDVIVPLQGDGWTRPVLDAHHDNKVNDNLRAYDWGKLGTRSGTMTNFGTPNPIGDRRFYHRYAALPVAAEQFKGYGGCRG